MTSDFGVETETLRDWIVEAIQEHIAGAVDDEASTDGVFANPGNPHQIVYVEAANAQVYLVTIERATVTPLGAHGPG